MSNGKCRKRLLAMSSHPLYQMIAVTGTLVHPIVGYIRDDLDLASLQPNPREVRSLKPLFLC